MSDLIPYGRQTIDDDDVAAVVRALRSDFLTTGPEIDAFEAELAQAAGACHAVVVANGTAALHCAYAAAGLKPGDEVITTPLTFSATANMALAVGARPLFVDVDPRTLCIDPAEVARAIGPRTRAIAPVDFAGQPADMDAIMALARDRGLTVIADAAHSIGGRYRGRPVGSLAHATTFSFHPVKTITTAEGGAVVTDDPELARRARDFRNHGLVREPERLGRHDGAWYYEVQSLGFNYRLSTLHAALGRSQLKKLGRFAARRAEIVARYRAALAGDARVRLVECAPGLEPAWHLFPIRVERRAEVFAGLQRRGVLAQVHYIAVNDLPLYRGLGFQPESTPKALAASRELISLPLYPSLRDEQVDLVVQALREALAESGRAA